MELRPHQRLGLLGGVAIFGVLLVMRAPATLSPEGWRTAAVVALMAIWWIYPWRSCFRLPLPERHRVRVRLPHDRPHGRAGFWMNLLAIGMITVVVGLIITLAFS